ncbi:MAG TPA: hypothetical protein PL134_03785 [Smithellaceae bacterium]|nr:hypothetical protein [Smithellaceae bacterium]HQG95929.1 hypothetical protein [Smithellaceae bacterium]HQM43281.1 hypothetical protein [Smithellaceae bacterium]
MAKKILYQNELFKIISAIHQSYEVYVERRFREGFGLFNQALMDGALEGQKMEVDFGNEKTLNSYIRKAQKRHNKIFYYFLNGFGQELFDVFAQMDNRSPLDAATQTNRCSAAALKVIFNNKDIPKIAFLDKITAEIFVDIGKMLGLLLNEFSASGRR